MILTTDLSRYQKKINGFYEKNLDGKLMMSSEHAHGVFADEYNRGIDLASNLRRITRIMKENADAVSKISIDILEEHPASRDRPPLASFSLHLEDSTDFDSKISTSEQFNTLQEICLRMLEAPEHNKLIQSTAPDHIYEEWKHYRIDC